MTLLIRELTAAPDGRPWLVVQRSGDAERAVSAHASYGEAVRAAARVPPPGREAPPEVVDPSAAWAALPARTQAQLGMAAIAAALGSMGAGDSRAHESAYAEAMDLLEDLVATHVAGRVGPPPRPDLARLGIRACRGCGCTDAHGCEGGCHWEGAELCSNCADARRAAGLQCR